MTLTDDASPPQTIPYHLAERLRTLIIRGRLPPGANLRELDIAAQFHSSRGPVREAFRVLEQQGLVEHSPRRGFRVKAHTDADLRNIYHLRGELEGMAVESLRERDVAPLVKELRASNERMKAHAKLGALDAYFQENLRFHQTIADYTLNVPLIRMLSLLSDMALPVRYFLISRKFPKGNDYAYHDKIARLIEQRQFDEARVLTTNHILANLEPAAAAYREISARVGL